MFKAPVIYFPSTVAFLDDDALYAKMLIHRLPVKNFKHFESLEFLLRQRSNDLLFTDRPPFEANKGRALDRLKKNLDKIKVAGNLISVLVSDLYMKDLLGTDIFSELQSPYLGRILVSNFVGYQNADIINYLNDGSIDIVLDKTHGFVEQLPKAIIAAKNKFFTALSNELFCEASREHPLSDTEFAKFFVSKIAELQPNEIVPSESLSRFTFKFGLDRASLSFHMTTAREIKSQLASSAAESAPREVLSNLSNGRYILCNEDPDDILPDGQMWPLFIRPAKQFITKTEQIFYCISEQQEL